MACPTCDHTMTKIGTMTNGAALWACPRCGTINGTYFGETCMTVVPKLVERCRKFERSVSQASCVLPSFGEWKRLGIAESIGGQSPPSTFKEGK